VSEVIIRRPSALRDLGNAAEFIRAQSGPDRAIRFLREAEATLTRLARMPGFGTRYEPHEATYTNLRYFPISRHRSHLIFYQPITNGIEVLRVLHGARDIQAILAEDFQVGEDTP